MPAFARTIGIDYSGAETPTASLKGLRVYLAEGDAPPVEVPPPPSPAQILDAQGHRRMAGGTARRGCADAGRHRPRLFVPAALFRGARAVARLAGASSTISSAIGRPTRITPMSISSATASVGNGAARMGNARWRRLTEERAGGAKSVFHFDVQGSVAKSTHAGIPWLRFIRQRLGRARAFLAVRRLGHPGGALGHRRGLSGVVVARLRQRGPHRRPARRLQHRRLAFARRPGWQPCGVPEARSNAARTHGGAG